MTADDASGVPPPKPGACCLKAAILGLVSLAAVVGGSFIVLSRLPGTDGTAIEIKNTCSTNLVVWLTGVETERDAEAHLAVGQEVAPGGGRWERRR